MDDIIKASAKTQAEAIRQKEISSYEIVEAHIRRIEEINPSLNAVVQLSAEAALESAIDADNALSRGIIFGPLHGVPFTVKDSFDTAGIITTAGTKGRESFIPDVDATVVSRLKHAGSILLGKTNTPEFTFSDETDNLVYGRTNNPYNLSRSSGGSSGGAGAIIAAYGSPLDVGTDTGGSIRTPSHFCGITGIKPTAGRTPRTGHIVPPGGRLNALTHVGPMARYVEDLILTLPLMVGLDKNDPFIVPVPLGDPQDVDIKSLRIAFYTDNKVAPSSPETVDVVRRIADVFSGLCQYVEEDRPPGVEYAQDLFARLWHADGCAWVRKLIKEAGTTETHKSLGWSEDPSFGLISMQENVYLMEEWDNFRIDMLDFMEKYDIIFAPVGPSPALEHGFGLDLDSVKSGLFSYVKPYNLTGFPCVVVRGGTSPEGLPIGVQVIANAWQDHVALATALLIEAEFGGWRPPII